MGDKISFTLADDTAVDTQTVARKGWPAFGTVIHVDKAGAGGLPGQVNFEVNSLDANGTAVKLLGSAAKEGQAKPPNAAVLIPIEVRSLSSSTEPMRRSFQALFLPRRLQRMPRSHRSATKR